LWRVGPPLHDLDSDADIDIDSIFFSCEMGETWSDPVIGRVKIAGADRYLMFVGGGYDELSQDLVPPSTDIKGRALFAIDVFTGQKVWEYTKTLSVDNDALNALDNMTYAISSQATLVDSDGNRYIDRIYVGDLGGQLWRFDVGNNDTAFWTGKTIFKSNPGADSSGSRKILYPPDYVQEIGYDVLFFGTGDREHPRETTAAVDRLYAVKDDGQISTALTESDLKDVTTDDLQSLTVTVEEQAEILSDLADMKGWYIKLDQNEGEKVVAQAAVFAKVAYFTTYAPDPGISSDPCQVNRGTARAYAVNYLTGEAVFNYDTTNDTDYDSVTNTRAKGGEGEVLQRSDRLQEIGTGIPSGVVIIINETGEMGLIGVGGGLNLPEVKAGQTAIRIYWRTK
jgi:type IV pilus assembly protein PilY1